MKRNTSFLTIFIAIPLLAQENPKALIPALTAEQKAYQTLLRLQAHEFEVTRQQQKNQSQSQQRQNQRSQRAQSQLDQLDLRQQEDRYQNEKQAQKLQEPKQREQLQVLSRLKDLAQRQEDLNEKLKELENALRAAETEQKKEEIERQLKSLREEQRQNLEDLDEVNQRMEKPENKTEMKDQRQQLEKTRQEMNKAAEQMKKGQLSQAISSGTRAQRDLQEMRDDLREKTSSQFSEEMRNMRRKARELTQKQDELSKKLGEEEKKEQKRKSLTESDNKKEITEDLGKQQEKLKNLLNEIKEVVEQSELAEPLLNRKLYQTFREAHQDQTDKSLKAAATLLEQEEESLSNHQLLRNLDEIMDKDPDKQKLIDQLRQRDFREASKTLSDQSQRKMENLQKGVEEAAESVLGNEAEALKFAEEQLKQLSKALEDEKAEATGQNQDTSENERQTENQKQTEGNNGKGKPSKQQEPQPEGNRPDNPQTQKEGQPNERKPSDQEQQTQTRGNQQNNQPNQPNAEPQNNRASEQNQPPQNQNPNNQNQRIQQEATQPQSGPASFLEKGFSRNERSRNPITGGDHRQWTDRLRDVEEAVDRPELRDQVAQVREELRKMNAEFRRHSKEPKWALMEKKILQPLDEIRSEIAEELAKKESDRALVPIDRDPVPGRYSDLVEKYYERLGKGK